jgi:hypothetical protein
LFIQPLSLDRRRLDDVVRQRSQKRRLARAKSEAFDAADEAPLIEAYGCKPG